MAPRQPPPLTLAYHGVADVPLRRDPHGLFVSPRELERHIATLRRWGYRLVSFGELARLSIAGAAAGHASLTFDDGFADNLHTLAPLLNARDAPATVFVTSGWLGERHPEAPWALIMDADEVRALAAHGVEIGAHTHSHPDLTALSPDGARGELERSRESLEEILQSDVRSGAYPYGRADEGTRLAAGAAGLTAACRTSGQGDWHDPLDLPRQDMTNRASRLGLWLKRDDRYEQVLARGPLRAVRGLRRRALGLGR